MAAFRRAFCLTSWFSHPDVQMEGFEVLSRASACLVPAINEQCPVKFHVLATAHVTHPFRFPQYYPQHTHAFVHILDTEHIRCELELLEEPSGKSLIKAALLPDAFVHPFRDLSVLHLQDATAFMTAAAAAGLPVRPVRLAKNAVGEDSSLSYPMHPFRTPGTLLARSERQVFAKTNQLLQMGMCGGPVVDAADTDLCYGIVEGIVPVPPTAEGEELVPSKGRQLLSGAAVFVEAADIRRFLTHVEDVLMRS